MTLDEFDALEPIQNHLDKNASLDGCMFETFGEELQYVLQQPNNHIWTYIEEDNFLYYVSGYHLVNRLGYMITKKPYDGKEVSIKVHDFGIAFPVQWTGPGDNGGFIYGVEVRAYESYHPDGTPDTESHYDSYDIQWFDTKEERDINLEW